MFYNNNYENGQLRMQTKSDCLPYTAAVLYSHANLYYYYYYYYYYTTKCMKKTERAALVPRHTQPTVLYTITVA